MTDISVSTLNLATVSFTVEVVCPSSEPGERAHRSLPSGEGSAAEHQEDVDVEFEGR